MVGQSTKRVNRKTYMGEAFTVNIDFDSHDFFRLCVPDQASKNIGVFQYDGINVPRAFIVVQYNLNNDGRYPRLC